MIAKRYYLGGLIALAACQQPVSVSAPASPLYNLRTYFQAEIQRLDAEQPKVDKYTLWDKQEERKTVQPRQWAVELAPWLEMDVSRATWREKYRVDTLGQKGDTLAVRYAALDSSLSTRQIDLFFLGARLTKVEAHRHIRNGIYDTRQWLLYDAQQGYELRTQQHIHYWGQYALAVRGQFVKP